MSTELVCPQGGYNGLVNWLKLDPEYVSKYHMEIRDYAEFKGVDYDDPHDLLRILLEVSGASAKPWLHPVIDPKAMNDLALDAQTGNEDSRELLVLYMYKSVANVAKRFSWAMDRFYLERADLIHQGILGIYNALEKWSISERADFPYWAEQWIFASIQQMVTLEEPMVKIPHHLRILQSKLPKIRAELEDDVLGRHASYEELAFFIRSEGYDTGIKRMLSGPELAILEVHNVRSLNQVVSNDENDYIELMDLVPDDGSNMLTGYTDLMKEVEDQDLLEALMDKLDDVERFVTLNYNKGGYGTLKASEVAVELADIEMTGVVRTQSSISQIFDRACIKMRFAAKELGLDQDMIFE